MQGEIVEISESNENGNKKDGKVKTSDGIEYKIYKLPSDIQVNDRVAFNTTTSRLGNEYAVFENKIINYFKTYGGTPESDAIQAWIDTIDGLRNRVSNIVEDHQQGHDYIIVFNDGSRTFVEVKNEEKYWYERTGNITIDAISAFTVVSSDVQEYINKNRNWIEVKDYQRFIDGINIGRMGSLYESDADIMVKCIIGGDFVQAYDMQRMRKDAHIFKERCKLRINAKKDYGIEEDWESATYCVKPKFLKEYEIHNYDEIPKRN